MSRKRLCFGMPAMLAAGLVLSASGAVAAAGGGVRPVTGRAVEIRRR